MLNFIIGRKNSGKTATSHAILGKAVKEGKSTMLIVPKHFTFESDKSILSLLGPKDASEVEVLSFTRLCHIVLQTFGGITKPIAKKTSRLIYMSLALENLQDKLFVFAKHQKEFSLAEKMLSFVDEMKNEGITPEMLEENADKLSDRTLSEKMRECALIYRTYSALVAQSNFDDADLLSRIYEILCGEDFFSGKTIVLDGFSSFSADELKLISLMLNQAQEVYITLCLDEISSSKQTGPFVYTRQTARKLLLLAGNNGIETGRKILCKNENAYKDKSLSYLAENLYNPVFTPFEEKSEALTVITAPSFVKECDAVARKIKSLIRKGDYRCRDIAVVFREGESYERQLRLSFKKYGVPFFEDKRQKTVNQPIVNYVRSLLSVISDGFDSDCIFRLIKTGLTPVTAEESALMENYVYMWDIDGGKWLTEWKYNPSGFGSGMDAEKERELAFLNSLREKTVTPIVSLKEKTEGVSGKEKIRCIYEYLRENKVDERVKDYALSLEKDGYTELAVEQEQVWELLMEAFDDIAVTLDSRFVTNKCLCEIFNLVIREKTLGKLPDGFDEVSISSADRMMTKKSKVTFAVGLVAGQFPKTQSEGGLFSAFEKSKTEKAGLSLGADIKEKSVKERFVLYNCLASASEKLYLSYCTVSADGEKAEKSEAITLCQRIIPYHESLDVSQESTLDLIESEQSAFEIMAEKYREESLESDSLFAFFADKEEYKDRLDAIGRAVAKEPYKIEDKEKAVKLFGENMYVSASRAEVYAKCPFMYFCRYGVKANPRLKAKLDAASVGTVIHEVLEKLLCKYKGKEFLSLSDEKMKEEITFFLSDYMARNMVGAQDKDARFNYLYNRMFKILSAVTERLCGEFAESDFEPMAFEMKIEKGEDVSPYYVDLERGSVLLHGTVDRVDKMDLDGQRYVRVVDYKSGGKNFELSNVLAGLNMQMLLYLISIWRTGKGEFENVIPAGVLYFPAKMSAVTLEDRDEDELLKREKRFAFHKMSGMIIGGEETAKHMEKDLRGLYIPVSADKRTGKIKGKFIDLETLGLLAEKTDGIIREMGNSLHDGLIPACPVEGGDYTDTCLYCDYREVCLEENPQKRYFRKIPHEECFALLKGEGDKE